MEVPADRVLWMHANKRAFFFFVCVSFPPAGKSIGWAKADMAFLTRLEPLPTDEMRKRQVKTKKDPESGREEPGGACVLPARTQERERERDAHTHGDGLSWRS